MTAPLVEMRNVSKRFGAVVALRQVSLTSAPGRWWVSSATMRPESRRS